MRPYPHNPSTSALATMREELASRVDGRPADQWMVRAALDYAFEQPLSTVVQDLREGLREFRVALESDSPMSTWDLWNFFLYSLAAGDRALTHMIASLPDESWEPESETLNWLAAQARAAIALFTGSDAPLALEDLRALVFESPLPSGLKEEVPEIQNVCRLMEAILSRDSTAFNALLEAREQIRTESLRRSGTNTPIELLDLIGLGLCRLAMERGMAIRVRSVFLPLEILSGA